MKKFPITPTTKDWSDSVALHKIFEDTQNTKITPQTKRPNDFRVSSLPYCGLLHVADSLNKEIEPNPYAFSFYVELGTTLHSLYQRYAAEASPTELIGNWQCNRLLDTSTGKHSISHTRCTKKYEFCSHNDAKEQHKCPHGKKCLPSLSYEELTVEYKGLTGHVDLLYKLPNRKYILADIKTTGEFLFDSFKSAVKLGYYPSLKYFQQVETYAILIEKLFDIEISSYAIVYMSRTAPSEKKIKHRVFARKLTDDMRMRRKNIVKWQIEHHKQALKVIEQPSKDNMGELWNNRPCQNKAAYDNIMKPLFFGKENCPYWQDSTCPGGEIKRNLLKQLSDCFKSP